MSFTLIDFSYSKFLNIQRPARRLRDWQVLVPRPRRYKLQGHLHGAHRDKGVHDGQQDLCHSSGGSRHDSVKKLNKDSLV